VHFFSVAVQYTGQSCTAAWQWLPKGAVHRFAPVPQGQSSKEAWQASALDGAVVEIFFPVLS